MIEVEVKLAVEDLVALENKVKQMGMKSAGEKKQLDIYFNAPDRDFAKTDEALRIRIENGKLFLTYKGAKFNGETKSRREIEIEIKAKSAIKMRNLLLRLGYREVAVVNKIRRIYRSQGLKIYLDQVEQLGSFIEVEAAAAEKNFKAKRKQVFDLLQKLGLNPRNSIRQSYLELLLAKK
ncbi:MAG: class IV adenylate cyclase [Methanocellales archaeon]